MRFFLRGLLATALAATAGAVALAWLAFDPAPRVPRASEPAAPAADALRQLRQTLRSHDPRRARPGTLYVASATPTELQLLAGHAGRLLGGGVAVSLGDGRLELAASLPAPRNPFGGWLNTTLVLRDGDTLPRVERLTVGHLSLPGWLAEPLLGRLLARWDDPGDGAPPLHEMVQGVRLRAARAQLIYEWRADAPQRVLAWLLPPAQQQRLRAYQEMLANEVRRRRGTLPLPDLLAPMFALAQARSAEHGEPVAENRAALLTLALYVNRRPMATVLPAARHWPQPRQRRVVLNERTDFPQHLLTSAALAAEAGGPLADVLGLVKEVSDARYGSGFSFNDVAVNRSGARLGRLAVREPRALQAWLAGGAAASALVPALDGLPEFMPEAEFQARFGGIGAPAYTQMVAEIEARVAALPALPRRPSP